MLPGNGAPQAILRPWQKRQASIGFLGSTLCSCCRLPGTRSLGLGLFLFKRGRAVQEDDRLEAGFEGRSVRPPRSRLIVLIVLISYAAIRSRCWGDVWGCETAAAVEVWGCLQVQVWLVPDLSEGDEGVEWFVQGVGVCGWNGWNYLWDIVVKVVFMGLDGMGCEYIFFPIL